MKRFSLLLVAASVLGVSCERHEFEGPDGTRQLHEKHSAHADAAHPAADHAEKADHKEADHAEEKPAAH